MEPDHYTSLESLEKYIDELVEIQEENYNPDKTVKLKPLITEINQKIEKMLKEEEENQIKKSKFLYLKGKILDLIPEYSKEAEENLSKSVNHSPLDFNSSKLKWDPKNYNC